MNKKTLFATLLVIILLFIGTLYFYLNHQKKEKAKEDFWEKQKPRIETFFRYNYNDIESFHYTETNENPMGISISGYVNDDRKLEFTASVLGYEVEFNSATTVSPELGALRKDRSYTKPVDEIEKEQQNK